MVTRSALSLSFFAVYGCQNDVSAAEKQCTAQRMHAEEARNLPPSHSGSHIFLQVSSVMSAAKISSTDGSLKVSSAGTTKKNMEGQMNGKEVATGKVG